MRGKWLIPVVALLALSMACVFSGEAPATPAAPAAATEPAVAQAAPTSEPPVAETAAPTAFTPPTAAPQPTEAPVEEPTVEPSPEPTATPEGPQPFNETFDEANKPGWKYVILVGGEKKNKVYVDEGMLKFELLTKETYAYVYNENEVYDDMLVTAKVENKGDNDNAMAVACRMSTDGWYEMRVTSLSKVVLYRYDQAKKDRKQNPYVELMPMKVIRAINPGFKENEIALGCVGDEIHMFVNGTEIFNQDEVVTDDTYSTGYAGVGAMSFTTSSYGVNVRFKELSVEVP